MSNASVSIVTPPHWWDLPLEPATRRQDIARLVEERGAGLGRAERAALAEVLADVADAAAASGAVFASQFGLVDRGAGFSASLVVAVQSGTEGHETVEQALTDETPPDITKVELAAGPAVRRESRRRLGTGEYLQVQYFLTVGDDATIVISGSCVGLKDLDTAVGIFDPIVSTLKIDG